MATASTTKRYRDLILRGYSMQHHHYLSKGEEFMSRFMPSRGNLCSIFLLLFPLLWLSIPASHGEQASKTETQPSIRIRSFLPVPSICRAERPTGVRAIIENREAEPVEITAKFLPLQESALSLQILPRRSGLREMMRRRWCGRSNQARRKPARSEFKSLPVVLRSLPPPYP